MSLLTTILGALFNAILDKFAYLLNVKAKDAAIDQSAEKSVSAITTATTSKETDDAGLSAMDSF